MKFSPTIIFLFFFVIFSHAYEAGHIKIKTDEFSAHAWYPTKQQQGLTEVRYVPLPFTKKVSLIENAILPDQKKFPLIILSHGILGTETSYPWLAVALAQKGYIVIAPHHDHQAKEDFKEGELFRFWKRALVVTEVIDWTIARKSSFQPIVDTSKIYFIGHSVGGQTGLLLAGLSYDIQQVMNTADGSEAKNILAKRVEKAFANEKPSNEDVEANAKLYTEKRIKKFILLDPTPIFPGFSEESIKNLNAPLLYVGSSKSEIFNSDWVKSQITFLCPHIQTFETHAGHFVYANEGTWLGRLIMSRYFSDAKGVNRTQVHAKLLARIVDFLN